MTHHALKVTIPMHWYKIRIAPARALVEEIIKPLPSALRSRNSRRTQLDAQLLQRLDFSFPACGRYGDGEVGAAGAVAAVGFVEAKDVGYVCSGADELLDRVEERGSCVAGAGAP